MSEIELPYLESVVESLEQGLEELEDLDLLAAATKDNIQNLAKAMACMSHSKMIVESIIKTIKDED